ncbi:thioredoxin family protein [Vibrio zhanjiangensis]|uniref:Thioredoxin family protein n=1 Tax=Vibrio zhanjiangensis TaxID=1046128 RepID=A0ABQ6F352_9VIBR|nr:glutaredoxin family protein [Vibrio zhanjiangensis]GLT19275.1 thioredoxin family protein [Vibrio zhanjiangensis]
MITLYSTQGCHLCELAFDLCEQSGVADLVSHVDIAFDDELFMRYGVTIPVLSIDEQELQWPFDLQQLQLWLDNNGITYHK